MRRLIFTDGSVKLIEAGRKRQTRRIVKGLPPAAPLPAPNQCPIGAPGDTAVVRQAWRISPLSWQTFTDGYLQVDYRSGGSRRVHLGFEVARNLVDLASECWRSPMFMFNWAACRFVRLTSVSAQRVSRITEQDAIAEGYRSRSAFAERWDEINDRRGFPFDANPAVWAIGFVPLDVQETERLGRLLEQARA